MRAASNLPRPGTAPDFYGRSQSTKGALGPGGSWPQIISSSPAAAGARRGLGGDFLSPGCAHSPWMQPVKLQAAPGEASRSQSS